MTLLREIQDVAMGTQEPVAGLLRKAQVLASRLDHAPLRLWTAAELNGYQHRDDLPDYRRVGNVTVLGDFSGPFGSGLKNAPIPFAAVPENLRDWLFCHDVFEGVAQLEKMASGPEHSVHYSWPADIVAALADRFYEDMNCMTATRVVSTTVFVGVIDAVRTRLLQFALDIEKLDPDAGERVPGTAATVSPASVTQVFNTTIHGGQVALAAAGQGNVAQQLDQTSATPIGWERVRDTLRGWGLPDDQLAELQEALAQDALPGTDLVVGSNTQGWLGRLATRIAAGAVQMAEDIGVDVIAALLTKAAGG